MNESTVIRGRDPTLFDLVAVLKVQADAELEVGDVGTVVEVLPPDGVEVEFLTRTERTRCVATLRWVDILALNSDRTPVGLGHVRLASEPDANAGKPATTLGPPAAPSTKQRHKKRRRSIYMRAQGEMKKKGSHSSNKHR